MAQSTPATPVTLTSPDAQIAVQFNVVPEKSSSAGDGRLVYSLAFHGKPVLEDSGLALELDDLPALGAKVHITGSERGDGVDDYVLQFQKVGSVHDMYNSLVVQLAEREPTHRQMEI